MNDLGIVVLNYNDFDETIQYCKKISAYKKIDVVVVVDNASTDDSVRCLKGQLASYSKVEILISDENKGYAAGNNIGIKYLLGKNYKNIIISNPDIEVSEDVINQMMEFVESKGTEKLGMCSPNAIDLANPNPMTAWKLPDKRMMILENIMLLSRLMGDTRRYNNISGDSFAVECLPGCFFLVTADAIRSVGGGDG